MTFHLLKTGLKWTYKTTILNVLQSKQEQVNFVISLAITNKTSTICN